MKNQAENDLQLSCVRLENPVNYVKVRFGSLGFGLLDFPQLGSSSFLDIRAMSNEDNISCLRRMEYIPSTNELNCCIAPTFGWFAWFDRQFLDYGLKRAYKRP